MHETISKRIFVGGLANEVTAGEIVERFSKFGKVGNLSFKTRRDESGNVIKSFAHLDLEGDEANIKKCFHTYQNTKWKGSVLQLQYAKESFLQKLEKEREEAQHQQEDVLEVKPSQTSQPQLFEINGPAVPGTPVPGKKDWVVGKYGRVLPILKLKKSYKIKMVKYDPSKHCHAARVFKDDKTSTPADTSCHKLTWEINTPDSEITRKRKGEFPQTSASVKKIKKSVLSPAEYFRNIQKLAPKMEEVEFVKSGTGHVNAATKLIKSNRFDSDLESDSEGNSFNQNVSDRLQTGKNNQLHGPTTGCRTVKENNEVVKLKCNENKSNKNTMSQSADKRLIESASVNKNALATLGPKMTEVEFVKVRSGHVNAANKLLKSNRFDSDLESNSEGNSFSQNVTPGPQTKVISGAETSKPPQLKHTLQKESCASTVNKIPKFGGLSILGLLGSCSKTCQEKLEMSNDSEDYESGDKEGIDKIVKEDEESEGNDEDEEIDGKEEKEDGESQDIDEDKFVEEDEESDEKEDESEGSDEEEDGESEDIDEDEDNDEKEDGEDEDIDEKEDGESQDIDGDKIVEEEDKSEGSDEEEDGESEDIDEEDGESEDIDEEEDGESGDIDEEEDGESGDIDEEEDGESEDIDEDEDNDEKEDGESQDIDAEGESMEDKDVDEKKDIDDDEERDTDYAEMCKSSTDFDKRLKETSDSMIVAQKVIRKTSWCPASEKFKNSTVPIIDMRALRFDPTKIQKTEMMADENETPPQLKVATAFLRNQTQTGNKLHKTSTVEVSQNKHIVNERSVVQEDKSDTVKKAGKIDVRKKPATQPAAERLNHVNKKPVTQPAAERLNNVNKKPVTLPAAERLSNVNKKPVTLPAAERLNNVNKKPATLLAAERLNNVNKKPVTLPAAERLNNVNKKPVTLPAAERLNNVNKKPVTLPAAERLNKKPVTLPATERLNKKPVTLSAAERLNNVQMKPVRGSVVKSVGSKTKIHMTSSLVGLFKKKKLDTVYHEESTPFSLQQFFDQQLVTGKNEDNKRFNSNKGSERVDARDVGAQPLETLADVRPALLKTYTQEHKETIKSERKHGEFKQGKFLAKTGRHQNKR